MKSLYNADRWVALHFPMEEWPRDIITGSPEVTHRPQDTGAGAQNLVLWYIFPASSASFPTHAMWWTPPVDLWKYLLLPSSPTQLPAAVDTHRPGGTCRDWARSPPPHPHPSTTLPPPRADVGSPCPVAWPFWQHTKRCRNAPSFRTQKEICSASNFFSLFFLIKKKTTTGMSCLGGRAQLLLCLLSPADGPCSPASCRGIASCRRHWWGGQGLLRPLFFF